MARRTISTEWQEQFGAFLKAQRRLAELSQRELARMTNLSDPYLSQLERGLHEPSIRVVKSIARALNIPAETMLRRAGLLDEDTEASTEAAIHADPKLTQAQKDSLIAVYRNFVADAETTPSDDDA